MNRITAARRLRRDMTDAEQMLWSRLRNRQMQGLKFRQRMPIEGFIADFACVEARLVIELDGGQHADTIEGDRIRSEAIESAGYLVVRFWNNDVLQHIDTVMEEIDRTLGARPAASP